MNGVLGVQWPAKDFRRFCNGHKLGTVNTLGDEPGGAGAVEDKVDPDRR